MKKHLRTDFAAPSCVPYKDAAAIFEVMDITEALDVRNG
jgi:hypothetical protein